MKTAILTLQGHDFVVSTAALLVAEEHIRAVKKAAWFHRRAYRDNMEALRDVLMEQGSKTISKAAMANAVNLVGIPDEWSPGETLERRFPRLSALLVKTLAQGKKLIGVIGGHWLNPVLLLLSVGALFMSVNYAFLAFRTIQSANQQLQSPWETMETTIGRIRTYTETSYPGMMDEWLFGWQIHLLYAVLLFVIAVLVLRLRRSKYRLPFTLVLLACIFFLTALWQTQQQIFATQMTNQATWVTNAQPLTPRLAYLQQCGDEIPLVDNQQTAGMLFRQFRDEGFVLAVEIPTNYAHPDLKELCIQYDKLRKSYAKGDIILQLYTKQADGTLRPYMYSDARENTAAYGFFVKGEAH